MTGDDLFVFVDGRPRPQPRGRAVSQCALANKRGGKKCPAFVVSTMDDGIKHYRNLVKAACKQAAQSNVMDAFAGKDVAISFKLVLWFPTNVSSRWYKPHLFRPDSDNVAKLWQDAAVDAGLIVKGDSRVADLRIVKAWTPEGGAFLSISHIDQQEFQDVVQSIAGEDDGEG